MPVYIADTYTVPNFRGREVTIINELMPGMFVVELTGDAKNRILHVTKENLVDSFYPKTENLGSVAPAKVTRMEIIEALQHYESVLYRVWEGDSDADEVTDVMEQIIALVQG